MRRFVILVSVAVLAAASANCGGGSEKSVLGPSSLSGSDAVSANGKGGGRKPGGGGTTGGSGTLSSPVILNDANGNGLPSWRDTITFTISSTATGNPFVRVDCYQGGSKVFADSKGFFPSYPWPQEFYLSSGAWTGGAADCTATLYTLPDGVNMNILATRNFRAE